VEKLIIFGASAGARLIYHILTEDSAYQIAGFTVDREYVKEPEFCGLPVVPFDEVQAAFPPGEYKMLVAILGDRVNKTRAEKYLEAKAKGYEFISYVHSKATRSPDLIIGENCFISDFAICRPSVKIGNNVMVMSMALLGIDAVVEDHCYIAVRASLLGGNRIEPYSFIGANSTILEGITVARECVIGAGAVIHENTQAKGVYRVAPPTLLPLPSDRLAKFLFRKQP
jgi:sugar O-acyltransferase (sialic acid O-acetyltransferase NeuD family)